jgi:CHAD domain-containing protein
MLARPLPEFINAALRRGRRRLKRRAADAEKEATVESLHALRIEAKKARYAAEAFRTLYRAKPARRYLTALERLQDVLGIVNDADTARQLAAELPLPARAARARDLVAGWTASEIEHGRRAFTAAWRDFLAAKPFWRE